MTNEKDYHDKEIVFHFYILMSVGINQI